MITCPNCQTENRDGARFCTQCATPLAGELACPVCGTANPAQARFCLNCAAPLRGVSPPGGLLTGQLQPQAVLQGRYIIVQRVGHGGMGAVYQATDQRIPGKLWAIKEMSDAAITDPLDRQRAVDAFRQEAQLLATLDHGNLPKVSDYFTEGGKHYLVMDFIQGQTLEQILHGAPGFLPERDVVGWAVQLCEVLSYLHHRQPPIIFRDLKPGNVMLDAEGRIKLIDFGIARLFRPGKGKDTQVMGTPGYAAPEQYGAGQTDARSDIYALGVTLHQLLTRYDPSLSPFNLPPARNVNPALSPAMEAVIAKATQPDVTARFQTATEMKQALTGQVPPAAAPRPAAAPGAPASAGPVTPYQLTATLNAATIAELPAICDADWDKAVEHFAKGYLTGWLRDIEQRLRAAHQHGPADDVEKLAQRGEALLQQAQSGDEIARHAALEAFLQAIGGVAAPALGAPPTLDLGTVEKGQVGRASLTLTNQGRGYLSGEVKPTVPWLTVPQPRFGCRAGRSATVEVQVKTDTLPPSPHAQPRALHVTSNGGQADVAAQVQVFGRPRLEVSPAQLAFNELLPGTRAAQPFQVRNAGWGGALDVQISSPVPWLGAEPAAFRLGDQQAAEVRAWVDSRALGNAPQRSVLQVRSTAGNAAVTVEAAAGAWVLVPAGEFLMGSDKKRDRDASDDETPQHQVYLDAYYIGRTPVTNAQYQRFVQTAGHPAPKHWEQGRIPAGLDDHPVVYVSWDDAVAYCQWLTGELRRAGILRPNQQVRLPTEAEWEKAARGGLQIPKPNAQNPTEMVKNPWPARIYPWGDGWDSTRCNSTEGGKGETTPVGAYPAGASPYGCLDMAGNVWEWCADWYAGDYYRNSPASNPAGPYSGSYRVLRGGSWYSYRSRARAAYRNWGNPDDRGGSVGFRCGVSPTSSL